MFDRVEDAMAQAVKRTRRELADAERDTRALERRADELASLLAGERARRAALAVIVREALAVARAGRVPSAEERRAWGAMVGEEP